MNTEQFIYPTIFEPVYHGLDLTVPPDLGNQALARLGYVDVTAAPFHADPTGKRDATQALQAAVNFARDRQMVCFLPAGDYRVSDTIDCVRNYYRWRADRIAGARHHPCMLVGSVKDPRRRARIVLAPHSPGFTDPNRPKRIVKFWARASSPRVKGNWSDLAQKPGVEQANICFNQMIVSIDISIGEGNPGAVGIYLRGAQGSGAQDVAIDARHGHTGLEGGVGSGGAHLGITVIGGRIGMDLTEAQPAPTIGGITLIGQTEAALRYSGWGGLAAAGLDIRPAAGAVAIQGGAVGADDPFRGHLSVVDCTIDYERWNTAVPAIETCKSLCLENVFVRNAATAVRFDGEPLAPGRPNVWTRIASFARGAAPRCHHEDKSIEYAFPVYANGEVVKQLCVADEQTPPAGLCARHLWSGEPLSFEARDVANAKEAPYGARGDGLADDSAALQKAIDENERVFLPKGHYLVSRPIRLRPNTKLFGVSPICSNILIREPGEFFSDAARPSPVLETPDVRQGGNTLAFLSVTIPHDAPGAIAFRHQSGGALIRSCRFAYHFHPVDLTDLHAADFERLCPLVVATGSAGGKWYMHYEEMPVNGPRYRHLLIEGTSQPLAFYQLNIEHAAGDAQMEIRDSRNIRIFGFKSERNAVVARIDNSRDIALHSCGGNATPFPGKSLIELIDCKSIRLENLVDLGRIGGKSCEDIFGLGINPMLWTSVHSERDGETFATKPCERPACFIVDWQPVT